MSESDPELNSPLAWISTAGGLKADVRFWTRDVRIERSRRVTQRLGLRARFNHVHEKFSVAKSCQAFADTIADVLFQFSPAGKHMWQQGRVDRGAQALRASSCKEIQLSFSTDEPDLPYHAVSGLMGTLTRQL